MMYQFHSTTVRRGLKCKIKLRYKVTNLCPAEYMQQGVYCSKAFSQHQFVYQSGSTGLPSRGPMGKRPQTAEIGKHLVTCPTIIVGRQRLVNSNIFFYFVCAQLNITCADIAQCKVELICFKHRYKIEFPSILSYEKIVGRNFKCINYIYFYV